MVELRIKAGADFGQFLFQFRQSENGINSIAKRCKLIFECVAHKLCIFNVFFTIEKIECKSLFVSQKKITFDLFHIRVYIDAYYFFIKEILIIKIILISIPVFFHCYVNFFGIFEKDIYDLLRFNVPLVRVRENESYDICYLMSRKRFVNFFCRFYKFIYSNNFSFYGGYQSFGSLILVLPNQRPELCNADPNCGCRCCPTTNTSKCNNPLAPTKKRALIGSTTRWDIAQGKPKRRDCDHARTQRKAPYVATVDHAFSPTYVTTLPSRISNLCQSGRPG